MDVTGEAKAVEDDVSASTETKQSAGSIGNVASKSTNGPAASLSSMGPTEGGVGAARQTHNAVRSISHGRRVSMKGTQGRVKDGVWKTLLSRHSNNRRSLGRLCVCT